MTNQTETQPTGYLADLFGDQHGPYTVRVELTDDEVYDDELVQAQIFAALDDAEAIVDFVDYALTEVAS